MNFDLRTIRCQMNRRSGIYVHKPETVLHVRRLKLHRKRRKGHHREVWSIWLLSNNQNNQNNNNDIEVATMAFHDGLLK